MKKPRKTSAIIMVFSLMLPSYNSFAQTAEELLPKAIQQEEVKGELYEAIRTYQLIMDDYPDNREICAEALLHLGICYEKLGLDQARQTYRQVISKYPEQEDKTALARERIYKLDAYNSELMAKAEEYLKKGNELFKRWEYESAIKEYENAVSYVPNNELSLNARYCIGQSWYRAGKYDKALATFTKLIEENPKSNITPVSELMIAQVKQSMLVEKSDSTQLHSMDGDTVVDPETGIKYTKIRSFVGKNDLISYTSGGFNLSPDCRFMVLENTVVPVDGTDSFKLVEMDANRAVYAPGMKRAAFYSDSAIWAVPVSPETGRATGKPFKLVSGRYKYQYPVSWSPDGERLVYTRFDKEITGDIWIVNSSDAKQTPVTDSPDLEGSPVWSPDGRYIVYSRNRNLWMSAIDGSGARMIIQSGGFPHWYTDSKWLFHSNWENHHLYSFDQDKNYKLVFPKQVGTLASFSPDGKKVLFYKSSSDIRWPMKIVSSAGGPPFVPYFTEDVYDAYWSPDDQFILANTENEQGYKIMALTGGTSRDIKIETSVNGKPFPFRFSDDLKQIAFTVLREDGLKDIYVAPFSMVEARTTGPAKLVFGGWSAGAYNVLISWSRDGGKMAVVHEGDIWIVQTDSGKKEKLTDTSESERWVDFSPDGTMLSYFIPSQVTGTLNVIPVSGGPSKVVNRDCKGARWLKDSDSMVILSNDNLQVVSLDGKTIRQLLNIKDIGLANDGVELRFSPDSKCLAFVGYIGDNDHSLIITYSMETGKVNRLCDENLNDGKYGLLWSHDGKWISYLTYEEVKVRPEGSLWEADFDEVIDKLTK